MNSDGLSLLLSAMWIIPLFVLGVLVAFYVLVRYWQKQAVQDLKPVLPSLNKTEKLLAQTEAKLQGFSVEDPEPFGSLMKKIDAQLNQIGEQIAAQKQRYVTIQTRVRKQSLNQWQALIGASFFWFEWYRMRADVTNLLKEISTLEEGLSKAGQAIEELNSQGWTVAGQVRELVEVYGQANELIEQLRQSMRGDAFESALHQERHIRQILEQIPPIFLEERKEVLLEQAQKSEIIKVHDLLAGSRSDLQGLLTQLKSWESQYDEASGKVAVMHRLVSEVRQLMDVMPAELDLKGLEEDYRPLAEVSNTLKNTLSRLEVENIGDVNLETERVHRQALDISHQLRRSRRQLIFLEPILSELHAGLEELLALFSELGTAPPHPVVWNESSPKLRDLNRRTEAIGVFKKQRTPEQVEKDLSNAGLLNTEVKNLASHCQEIAQAHAALLELWSSPELTQSGQWFESAFRLAVQAKVYDPENWPRADSVDTLEDDLQMLDQRQRQLIPMDPASPIQESEIDQLLKNTRSLVGIHQSLRIRVQNIQTRLDELKGLESNTREAVVEMRAVLNQIIILAKSNDLLSKIAPPVLERLQGNLKSLDDALSQQKRGGIQEKEKRSKALIDNLESSANGWLDLLNQDIETQKTGIADLLDRLEQITSLDEGAVENARRLLAQDLQTSVVFDPKRKSDFPLDEIVSQMKPRCDFWQLCKGTFHEIDEISEHILDAQQQINGQRESAIAQIAALSKYAPEKRSWPPTSLTSTTTQKRLEQIDEELQAMRTRSASLPWAVRRLSELSSSYQILAENAEGYLQRAEEEQKRVKDIEAELDRLLRRWQAQERFYANDPRVVETVRRLRADISKEIDEVRRQWLYGAPGQEGLLSYDQILQSLIALARDVQNARIAVGEGEDGFEVGIDGEIRSDTRLNRWRY
jgi:hypothetical protein